MNPFAVTNCFEISVLMCVSLLLNNCRPFHFQNIVLYLASQCHKHLTAVIHNSSQNSVVIMNAAFSVHMSLNNRFLFQYPAVARIVTVCVIFCCALHKLHSEVMAQAISVADTKVCTGHHFI